MKLSVILLTWNSEKDIPKCIDSLLESLTGISHEIVVVDNGSTDRSKSLLEGYGDKLRLIYNKENKGVSKGRNKALKEARGEYIWILDIDTIVNREAIGGMIRFMENETGCGMCACKLTSEQNETQDSCRKLPYPHYKVMNLLSSAFRKDRIPGKLGRVIDRLNHNQFYREELSLEAPFAVDYLIGACQLFRREVLAKSGLLDEQIFYGPEDADFCLRFRNLGYTLYCLPAYSITHHYNRISNKRIFSRMSWLHFRGLLYFYRKHRLIIPKTTN